MHIYIYIYMVNFKMVTLFIAYQDGKLNGTNLSWPYTS